MSVVGIVSARGGSKGVPRKNLRLLGGRPLIAHAIGVARASSCIDRIIVSTDDREIADLAVAEGAEAPFLRPAELATDEAAVWHSWGHALAYLEGAGEHVDVLVELPPTSPFRVVADVNACVRRVTETGADGCLTVTAASRNPYFNMVRLQNDRVRLVVAPDRPVVRRQDAPTVYEITTVAYALRPTLVRRVVDSGSLWAGSWAAVEIPPSRALDIDTELDLQFAEFLLRQREAGCDS